MRQQILSGEWSADQQLKSETDFAQELGVSRGTMRKAISTLIDEGLLVRMHGRGTFVSKRPFRQMPLGQLVGFSRDLNHRGIPYETRAVEKKVLAPEGRPANLLQLSQGEKIFFMRRVRYVMGSPLLMIQNHIRYDLCEGIEQVNFNHQQLYHTLENEYHFELDWAQRIFEAQVADAEIAELLEIAPGDPVMFMEQLYHLKDGTPVELSWVWSRGDKYQLAGLIYRQDEIKTSNTLED
jgi:DNA-binding GntR family transcriptional regulator